jgi:hypothetical protein
MAGLRATVRTRAITHVLRRFRARAREPRFRARLRGKKRFAHFASRYPQIAKCERGRKRLARCRRGLHHDFDATIVGATLGRGIVRDRPGKTETLCDHAV